MNDPKHNAVTSDEIIQEQQLCADALARSPEGADFPMTDEGVLETLNEIDYRVDLETLHRYIAAGYMEQPEMVNGRRQWATIDLVRFKDALEFRRMWKPFSRFHDPKKSYFERLKEQANTSEVDNPFTDLDKFSLEDLLLYMRSAETQHVRDMLYISLKVKLELND